MFPCQIHYVHVYMILHIHERLWIMHVTGFTFFGFRLKGEKVVQVQKAQGSTNQPLLWTTFIHYL